MKAKFLLVIVSSFAIIAFKGCEKTSDINSTPLITSLTATPEAIHSSDSSNLICTASDADGDKLRYLWESVSGSLIGTGSNITWVAPDNEGTYPIIVYVSDDKGGEATETVEIEVSQAIQPTLLYLRGGDPATWTIQGIAYSQYEEIRNWEAAGYAVTTQDLNATTINASLLNDFNVLRLHNSTFTTNDGIAIKEWVENGGCLLAEIAYDMAIPAISNFGVETIAGNHGGSSGLDWVYHGAPWTFGPVTGPFSSVTSMAAASMDRPILSSNHTLTVDASVGSYPIVVHGEFSSGKVVIIFATHWSIDAEKPNNAYRATIFQKSNLEFLENCIKYFHQYKSLYISL